MVLFLYPWFGFLYLIVMQIVCVYKILSLKTDRYFEFGNNRYYLHYIFLILFLVSLFVRLLFFSMST